MACCEAALGVPARGRVRFSHPNNQALTFTIILAAVTPFCQNLPAGDLAEVKTACERSNAASFIEGFPETATYGTLCGEKGERLSKKQRINEEQ